MPGGKVGSRDGSIKHAVVREVFEETGLVVTGFKADLKPMLYATEKVGENGEIVSKRAIQLSYVVFALETESGLFDQ